MCNQNQLKIRALLEDFIRKVVVDDDNPANDEINNDEINNDEINNNKKINIYNEISFQLELGIF